MSAPRTFLITGAANGIGRAVAEHFANDAAHRLILLDRDLTQLEAWTGREAFAANIEIHGVDIADLAGVQALFKALTARISHIDVLVNSAGVCNENEPEDLDNWHKVISVNLNGTFYIISLCLPLLADQGRIINLSSILGRIGKVRNTAYCASKHGIIGMTKALALDLAPRRITVNAILPAWIDTPMLQGELAVQAVNPEYRHGRRGDELLERIENRARAQGLKTLFVLTTRTAHWFRERGFEPSGVERLPAARASLYNYQRNSKIFEKAL